MRKRVGEGDSEELANWIVRGMQEKKAFDIVLLNLKNVKNAIADYFVICSGSSNTQIDAISDSIDEQVHKEMQQSPWHREGTEGKQWILLDYVDVVAHVFNQESREFYNLEDLWGDAVKTDYEIQHQQKPSLQ